MTCATCNTTTSYIRCFNGKEVCNNCGGFSEASGHKVDGALTRNSHRVRRQQAKYEGDFVQPHAYNKTTRKVDVNPDFVSLYPDKVHNYFQESEVKKAGYTKLPKPRTKKQDAVTFSGDAKKGIERVLG